MSKNYLITYKPLCKTRMGRTAIQRYGYPPFVDFSIRKEPDFQNPFPAISCLCRPTHMTQKLRVGDRFIYTTVKGTYQGRPDHCNRLVAILKVVESFDTHQEAFEWYRDGGLPIPRNCMVTSNPPLPFDHTSGEFCSDPLVCLDDDLSPSLQHRNGIVMARDAEEGYYNRLSLTWLSVFCDFEVP